MLTENQIQSLINGYAGYAVKRYGIQYGGADYDDVCGMVGLSIAEALTTVDEDGENPEAYIRAAAANGVRRWVRDRWGKGRASEISADILTTEGEDDEGDALSDTFLSREVNPADYAENGELAERVNAARDNLPADQAAVLFLHVDEGASFSQIEEITGIDNATAYRLKRDALAALAAAV